ncbi:radical SAM protein [Streptomyces sp. NPDC008092]|uniref:radical SAM protein n=1 Tax=Streptomyces sp. NPDC008092 TaxID=3364808 RepID=UPI0036E58FF9
MRILFLEITGKCQLECTHCYAESGPDGDHGSMSTEEWRQVIDQGAEAGMELVQFIGGEPTLHPDLLPLMRHALSRGLEVEVYSNLVHITEEMWEVFSAPGVRLATSYYSDRAGEHTRITKRNTHERTRRNISEAVRRGIPMRAGIVDVHDSQRVAKAEEELRELGVTRIRHDRVRGVGRGGAGREPNMSQLCGRCGNGRLAVSASGDVWPCVFSRWRSVGNVRQTPLPEILAGSALEEFSTELQNRSPQVR